MQLEQCLADNGHRKKEGKKRRPKGRESCSSNSSSSSRGSLKSQLVSVNEIVCLLTCAFRSSSLSPVLRLSYRRGSILLFFFFLSETKIVAALSQQQQQWTQEATGNFHLRKCRRRRRRRLPYKYVTYQPTNRSPHIRRNKKQNNKKTKTNDFNPPVRGLSVCWLHRGR